uniref:Uncharacterized protein n=1 Tax=Polytomella parva TaxID=51329 RepID=A0A7S0VL50_9CHLO
MSSGPNQMRSMPMLPHRASQAACVVHLFLLYSSSELLVQRTAHLPQSPPVASSGTGSGNRLGAMGFRRLEADPSPDPIALRDSFGSNWYGRTATNLNSCSRSKKAAINSGEDGTSNREMTKDGWERVEGVLMLKLSLQFSVSC